MTAISSQTVWCSRTKARRRVWSSSKKSLLRVRVTAKNLKKGIVNVANHYDFITLEHLNVVWSVSENGTVIQSGTIAPLKIKARSNEDVVIPFVMPENPKPGAEYFLNISFLLGMDTLWARCGHEIAWGQLALPVKAAGEKALRQQEPGGRRDG